MGQEARILFVDDESSILDGLRNLLRRDRKRWDMAFVTSGQEALAHLESSPADIVISDMRMPGMDGATLLAQVKELYPAAARVVLSGHAEKEAVMRALPVSQQFLSKPCDAVVLRSVIERTCSPKRVQRDVCVRELVGRLSCLPSFPKTYWELADAAQSPDVGMSDLAQIVQRDGAMTAKLLQLVNSSYFGVAQRITSVQQAVSYLGVGLVKGLALSAQVFGSPNAKQAKGINFDALQDHCVLVGRLAKKLVADPKQADGAFATGLVHDVGKLVLAAGLPDKYELTVRAAEASGRPLHDHELEDFGATHADIGAHLLATWGLPYEMVEAVASHHLPSATAEDGGWDLLGVLHIANAAARCSGTDAEELEARIDRSFIERPGVAERWPSLRDTALAEVRKAAEDG